ncbi:hypothetical protein B566_EDAN017374 [Ephemera danica]|nr:hypothetical protein B566_EDAN017374 [Ephemera danica]
MDNFLKDNNLDEDLVFEVKLKPILHLNSRNFTSFPDELKHFGQETQELYLRWNFISILPDWLSQSLRHLTNLYLSHNFLMHFPTPLCHLKRLEVLHLDNNCMLVVSDCIGNLHELVELNLSNNQITTLPSGLILLATDNQLRCVPEEVSQCRTLEQLALDRNVLWQLPRGLVRLPRLQYLGLSTNKICHLPALPFSSAPCISLAANPDLSWIAAAALRTKVGGPWRQLQRGTTTCCAKQLHVPVQPLLAGEAPSLLELSLRSVCKYLAPAVGSLPVNLLRVLQQGAVSECMHCQCPVFLQALVHVSHLAVDSQLPTHCLAFHCSLPCARLGLTG